MPPKRKATTKPPTERQQAAARTRAERQAERKARAAKASVARDVQYTAMEEEWELVHEVDQGVEFDQPEPGVAPTPTVKLIMTDELLAIMMQLQQQQQQ